MSRKPPKSSARRRARANPKPSAWSAKGPSRAYVCKSPLVGRTVRLGRSEVVVESCATPSRRRPNQGQFRVRAKATGKSRAVPRRRVSAALYRAKHPRKMPPGLLKFWAKTREGGTARPTAAEVYGPRASLGTGAFEEARALPYGPRASLGTGAFEEGRALPAPMAMAPAAVAARKRPARRAAARSSHTPELPLHFGFGTGTADPLRPDRRHAPLPSAHFGPGGAESARHVPLGYGPGGFEDGRSTAAGRGSKRLRVFLRVSEGGNVAVGAVAVPGKRLQESDDALVHAIADGLPSLTLPSNGYSYLDNDNRVTTYGFQGEHGLARFGVELGQQYIGIDYLRPSRNFSTDDLIAKIKEIVEPFAAEVNVYGPWFDREQESDAALSTSWVVFMVLKMTWRGSPLPKEEPRWLSEIDGKTRKTRFNNEERTVSVPLEAVAAYVADPSSLVQATRKWTEQWAEKLRKGEPAKEVHVVVTSVAFSSPVREGQSVPLPQRRQMRDGPSRVVALYLPAYSDGPKVNEVVLRAVGDEVQQAQERSRQKPPTRISDEAREQMRDNPMRWRANHHGGWHAPGDPLGYGPRANRTRKARKASR